MSVLLAPDFFDDARLSDAGEAAAALYVRALLYCAARGRVGYVCADELDRIAPQSSDAVLSALALEAVGLWARETRGGHVVGWAVTIDRHRVQVSP